ncbi:13706_t:CDS:2, partial [Dentiscutata heterogama]
KVADLPPAFIRQHFIQELQPNYTMSVQAAETDTTEAIAQLTDQIAQL